MGSFSRIAGTVHCIKYRSKQMYRYDTPKQDGVRGRVKKIIIDTPRFLILLLEKQSKPDPKQNEWQCKQDEKRAFEQNTWAGRLRLRRDERNMAGER